MTLCNLQPRKLGYLLIFLLSLIFCGQPATAAEPAETEKTVSVAQIEALKKRIEDPEQRAELISQLELLAQLQEPKAEKKVETAASELIKGLSQQFQKFSAGITQLTAGINDLPAAWDWLLGQATQSDKAQGWKELLGNLAVILLAGYLVFFIAAWLFRRLRRPVTEKPVKNRWQSALYLFGLLLLDLLPIAAFALVASLCMGFLAPSETTRLVVLTWINAFIFVQVIVRLSRFFFAPESGSLRFLPISDETAHYLQIWTRRLAQLSVYGFFFLQAAVMLGLPQASYEILLHLYGLFLTLLAVIVVFQNRTPVATHLLQWSEGDEERPAGLERVTRKIAGVWHLLVSGYLVLFYLVWALNIHGGFPFFLRASVLTLVACLIGWLALRILYTLFNRGVSINDELKGKYPGLEARANRYLLTLKKILRLAILLLFLLAVSQAWGFNAFHWMASDSGRIISLTILRIGGILLASFAIWEIATLLIQNYLNDLIVDGVATEGSQRAKTLLTIARKTLMIVLIVIGSLMVLSELGLDIGPLLAGAGVLGLAVGFGAQKLVQDVITGVFILIEDQISQGDVINVGDKGGVVEEVSIRTVRLRDFSGTVHTIPYSAISTVSNLTKDFSFYVFQVGVAYRENVDQVMELLKEIGRELQEDPEYGRLILEPLEVSGVDAFADSAVMIKARIKTVPIKQWSVGREFNRRMKNRFDELGIEIPFPHTTVYFGQDKQGQAPPAKLQFANGEAGHLADQASAGVERTNLMSETDNKLILEDQL